MFYLKILDYIIAGVSDQTFAKSTNNSPETILDSIQPQVTSILWKIKLDAT